MGEEKKVDLERLVVVRSEGRKRTSSLRPGEAKRQDQPKADRGLDVQEASRCCRRGAAHGYGCERGLLMAVRSA